MQKRRTNRHVRLLSKLWFCTQKIDGQATPVIASLRVQTGR
jgi:hypothetical protein